MILCGCMIQEGQVPEATQKELEQGLGEITQRFFEAPAAAVWTTVAEGDGWTAGEPSSSSLVVMYVPAGMEQDRRTSLLSELCDLWMAKTGCSINEIVATANDLPTEEN